MEIFTSEEPQLSRSLLTDLLTSETGAETRDIMFEVFTDCPCPLTPFSKIIESKCISMYYFAMQHLKDGDTLYVCSIQMFSKHYHILH